MRKLAAITHNNNNRVCTSWNNFSQKRKTYGQFIFGIYTHRHSSSPYSKSRAFPWYSRFAIAIFFHPDCGLLSNVCILTVWAFYICSAFYRCNTLNMAKWEKFYVRFRHFVQIHHCPISGSVRMKRNGSRYYMRWNSMGRGHKWNNRKAHNLHIDSP